MDGPHRGVGTGGGAVDCTTIYKTPSVVATPTCVTGSVMFFRTHTLSPPGSAWSSFWTPSQVHQGGTTARLATPLYTIPVFIKHGSVLWLDTRFDAGLHHSFGDEVAPSLMPELKDDALTAITALITQPSLDGTIVVREQFGWTKGAWVTCAAITLQSCQLSHVHV